MSKPITTQGQANQLMQKVFGPDGASKKARVSENGFIWLEARPDQAAEINKRAPRGFDFQ